MAEKQGMNFATPPSQSRLSLTDLEAGHPYEGGLDGSASLDHDVTSSASPPRLPFWRKRRVLIGAFCLLPIILALAVIGALQCQKRNTPMAASTITSSTAAAATTTATTTQQLSQASIPLSASSSIPQSSESHQPQARGYIRDLPLTTVRPRASESPRAVVAGQQ